MTVISNYHVTGTIGTSFAGDSTYSNLAGTTPQVVDAADYEKGWQFPSAQSLVSTNISSTTGRVVVDVVVNFAGVPTVASELVQIRGSAAITKMVVNGTGQFVLQNSSGTNTALGAVVANTKYRIRLDSNGTALSATIYVNDDDSTVKYSGTSTNAAVNAITSVRFGYSAAAGQTMVMSWPVISTDPADSGPRTYTAATAPTANAGGSKTVTVGNSVQLAGSGTSGGNGTLSYSWSAGTADGGAAATLTNAATATPTVSPSAGGVLHYVLTVTDSDTGLTATDTAIVYVPLATVRPIGVTSNPGAWTTTGAATANAALADSDVSTYTQSPDNPASAAVERIRLAPMLAGSGFSISLDHQVTASGAGTATVALYEGSALRKTWTITPSTTSQTSQLTLSASEIASIGSFNALDVELSWSVS